MRTPSLYVVLLLLPLSTLITAVPAPEGVIDDDPKVDTILTVYRYEGFGEQKLDTADKGDSFYYVYITGKADNEHNFDGPQNKYRKPNTCFRLDKLGEAMKPVE